MTALLAVLSAGAAAHELDLEQAFALAQRSNRQLATAREQSAEQEAALAAARARRWPSLQLSQRLTRIDQSTVERANAAAVGLSQLIGVEIPPFVYADSYRTQLDSAVPLWTGGGLAATVSGREESLRASQASQAATLRLVRAEVVRRFFSLASAEEMLRAREQALERAERRLQASSHRLEVGLTTRQEVLRWQVAVEAARAELAAAEAQLLVSRLELADTLGIELDEIGPLRLPAAELSDRLLVWAETLEPEEVLHRAAAELDALPELRQARALEAAAGDGVRAARSALLPRADLAATFGWLENSSLALDEFTNWSATLLVTVPLDARGDLRCELRRAAAEQRAAGVAVADTRAALVLAVGRAMAGLLASRTALRSARRAVQEAAARRELLSNQAEVGLATLLDLVDADTTLVESEVALASARSSFLAAVASLELAWPGADPPAGGLVP